MIYVVEIDRDCGTGAAESLYRHLPGTRKMRADRYLKQQDRVLSILSYSLLIWGIYQDYGFIPKHYDLLFQEDSKPHYMGDRRIHFNISHCLCGAAVAVAEDPVGIDMQDFIYDFTTIASGVYSKEELYTIQRAARPYAEATKYWTLKESYLKYLGCGLTDCLPEIDFAGVGEIAYRYGCYYQIFEHSEYYISLCSKYALHNMDVVLISANVLAEKLKKIYGY